MIPTLIDPAWALWSGLILLPLALAPILLSMMRQRLIQQVLGGTTAVWLRLRLKLTLVGLAAAAIAIALGQPIFSAVTWLYAGEVDVIAVFDSSESMAAADCSGLTRISFAKLIADGKLLTALKNNQMGVITFADFPQNHAFLSRDRRFLHWTIIRTVRIGASGEGSFVSKGLQNAIDLFRLDSKPTRQKLVVFFTDGGHEDEDKQRLAEVIAKYNADPTLHVQLVGLGGEKAVPISISNLSARARYLLKNEGDKRDQRALDMASGGGGSVLDSVAKRALDANDWLRNPVTGEVEMTARDDEFLRNLAGKLHGTYEPITRVEQFTLQTLSPQTQAVSQTTQSEQFAIPLSAAIVLLLLAYTCVRCPAWRARQPKERNNLQ
jgi:hypothetical protein